MHWQAACPDAGQKPDNTSCNCHNNDCTKYPTTASKACRDGECSVFICDLFNATICALTGDQACQVSAAPLV